MPSRSRESSIPVGTQFSPELLDLEAFLHLVVTKSGDHEALKSAVIAPPVRISPYAKPPTRRMRGLPLEAAVQYGLLEKGTYEATALAKEMSLLTGGALYERFARHILLSCGGLRVVQAAQQMRLDGLSVNGDSLARYLTEQGFRVIEHNTAINTMRMWLGKAGVFPEKGRTDGAWRPDGAVLERLVGMNDKVINALAALSPQQVAFAITLARRAPKVTEDIPAAEIRDLAEATHDVRIGRGSLPNEVLRPLTDAGLITFNTGGTAGGKTSTLRVTKKFNAEVLIPFLEDTIADLDPTLAAYFNTRPKDIRKDLDAEDTYTRGKALEAYVVYLMRLLGLRFLGWRRRAQETGFSEVDVLMAGLLGNLPTTWQIQCKNTPSQQVRLEDVAREVGLLPLTKATHIMVVANTKYTGDARRYADEIMQNSSVTIFLLDAADFYTVTDNPEGLGRILREQAEHIRKVKMAAPVWSGISRSGQT